MWYAVTVSVFFLPGSIYLSKLKTKNMHEHITISNSHSPLTTNNNQVICYEKSYLRLHSLRFW